MRSLAAVALSAGAYAALFPPFEWVPLSWLALVPLFLALRGRAPLAAAGLTFLWGYLMTVAIIAWLVPTLHAHFEHSLVGSVLFLLLFSAAAACPFYALAAGAWAAARPRLPPVLAPLLLAAAWVAAEYARTQLGFRSPWAKLGDAHYASERLRQVAALAGVYGVSGLVALGNAAAAEALHWAWRSRRSGPAGWSAAAVAVGAFAVLCGAALRYGAERRLPDSPPAEALEVALVQGNVAPELRWSRTGASHVLRRYAGLTAPLLADGAAPDLVVWPENAIQTALDDPVYGPPLRGLARRVPLLLGAPRSELAGGTRRHFNSAFLLYPDGRAEHYDKRRLLPFSETRPFGGIGSLGTRGDLDAPRYHAGRRPGLFDVAGQRLAVLICFEAVYPAFGREALREGATVLVNLSNDGWYRGRGGARQHLAQAVFRSVETGLPLVRATTTGVSAVVAPDGRIVAALGEGAAGVLRARVPPRRPQPTLYARLGDVFAAGCLLVCALAPLPAARGWSARARRPAAMRTPGPAPGSQGASRSL